MAINLQKGQRIDLTKGRAHLDRISIGLGWDPVNNKSGGGFFASFKPGTPEIDCDASVLMLENDRFIDQKDLIYFGQKISRCNSITHSGDNLTGEGEGDDETIIVELKKVPDRINKLVFVVNIYDCVSRKQDFGMIQNAYIRVVNPLNNEELVRYNLSENYGGLTTLVTGEIYRHNGEWKFAAVGDGTTDAGLSQICSRYQ